LGTFLMGPTLALSPLDFSRAGLAVRVMVARKACGVIRKWQQVL